MLRKASAAVLAAAVGFVAGAQGVATSPRFTAAEVQKSANVSNPQTYRSGGFLRGERYDLRKATMMDLIRLAYGFESDAVVGGPEWLEFDRFDVAASAPASTSPQEIASMLQALLVERFQLAFHKDVQPMPVFALRAVNARKLKAADGSGNGECKYQEQPRDSPYTVYSCREVTMAGFAQQLHGMVGNSLADPVIDFTGLKGAWDFDLKWTSRSVLPPGVERTTAFSALEQQLGLRLAAEKAPLPVIVIDHINETPSALRSAVALPPREVQFEVASVRASGPEVHDGYSGGTPRGDFEARGETMRNLFATAWDIHWDHVDEMIAGAPEWMNTARFDVQTRIPSATQGAPPAGSSFIDDDVRLMLRALLTERFKIRTHYEDRLVNAYTLVAARASSQKAGMKRADASNRANCKESRRVEHDPRELNPRMSRLLACQNVTMAQFAEQLMAVSANDFAYRVVDETGIGGRWDFLLNYAPTGDRRNPEQPVEPNGALSIFQAIQKQLGLKLELRKRREPVLVIDSIEPQPTDN